MLQFKILKKFLIPGAVLSAVAVKSDGKGDGDASGEAKSSRLRPSELPIYTGEHCRPPKKELACPERNSLEEAIGVVRKELWVWFDQYKGYRQKVIEVVEVGKAHTESTLEYLKEESNYMPRVGAIGLSGVAGYVLGMRGGRVRRLVYAAASSLTMAGLCYPRYGAGATKEVLFYAKKCFAIAYNFAYGVKPEGLELPHPSSLLLVEEDDAPVPAARVEKLEIGLATVPGQLTASPLTKEKATTAPTEQATSNAGQSNPADSDLYTNRR